MDEPDNVVKLADYMNHRAAPPPDTPKPREDISAGITGYFNNAIQFLKNLFGISALGNDDKKGHVEELPDESLVDEDLRREKLIDDFRKKLVNPEACGRFLDELRR